VRDPLAQGQQHRPRPLEIIGLATDHDRQGAGLGPRRAAGHRRIEPGHAAQGGQLGSHLTGGGWLQAGEVHQQLTTAPAMDDALLAEHHLAHHRRVGQAQQHHVRRLAQLGGAGGQSRTGGDQLGALARTAVPHGQRIPGGQQPTAHWQAHQANPGKTQRRQCSTHERLQIKEA